MTAPRALAPLAAGLLGLAGALAATLFLHRAALDSLDRVQEERLRGAGETAAQLLAHVGPDAASLRRVMAANRLEGAYVLSPALTLLADAAGGSGPADLLRVDEGRARRALGGERSVAFGYAVGDAPVATGYFPLTRPDGATWAVLVLEAGASYAAGRTSIHRALLASVGLSALVALVLAAAAQRWARAEARQRREAERASRGDAVARMAAMVAHEIRNPLGVIRGAVELVRARSGAQLGPRDQAALDDVLGEVERLRGLTEDFLDLAREPAIETAPVDLAELAAEAGRGLQASHPAVALRLDELGPLPVEVDRRRMAQVLLNLLLNSAQAGARTIRLRGAREAGGARLVLEDDGPGIAPALEARLFEPFVTGRAEGTGLGLAISRRIVERHGGSLRLLPTGRPGAAFELRLPAAE
ncbi:ATP-binding protein [Anaeromyxobacter paludicola]|uniref:ATP-binding protein n=1 Tax=Anaeromyxobacter paludicola TaxID=2918171 RepID=UPI0020BDF49A|nr:ATP-binding protein [Anaeromyxobacter paludicola]